MWIMGRDIAASEAKRDFMLTSASIVSALAKDGKKVSKRIMDALSGPKPSVEDLFDQMSETQRLIMFGSDDADTPDDQGNTTDYDND